MARRKVLCIVGASGSGKDTIARLLEKTDIGRAQGPSSRGNAAAYRFTMKFPNGRQFSSGKRGGLLDCRRQGALMIVKEL